MLPINLTPVEMYEDAVLQNRGLAQLFYDQVIRHPTSVAIFDDQVTITYGQLHSRACQLAHQLSQGSLAREEPVGIIVKHGISDIVAQMAIIYAGGSCAPMDPTLPDEQIQSRLQGLATRHILVDQANRGRHLQFIPIVVDASHEYVLSNEDGVYPVATNLSYRSHLIHTSGTTSEPKAVQILGRSILQVAYHAPFEPLMEADVVAHANNSSFDVSLFDVWAPLLQGACIAVLSKAVIIDLPALAGYIDRMGITVMATTTALFNLAAATYPRAFSKLRICFIGGEAANMAAIETVFKEGPPSMLINAYGPTECCVFCLAHRITPMDIEAGSVSIGLPIGRTLAYIVDDLGEPSEEGELLIGGAGVSPGYVNLPEKNAQAFITASRRLAPSGNPIHLYRTGDIVRRRVDGQFDYVGRRDNQVKIRGFRVELEAVETALLNTGHFSEAIAMKIESPQQGAGSMLVAYATPADTSGPFDICAALKLLNGVLPDYMIPHLELIDQMPLNSHAKVDRKHLSQLFRQRWQSQPVSVETLCKDNRFLCKDTRAVLANIWSTIVASLKSSYEDDDDFFVLGGTSLQASILIDQIRRNFDTEISLLTLYDNSTLSALATIIDKGQGGLSEEIHNDSDLWIEDTTLGDEIQLPPGPIVDWCRNIEGRVFFTGATGFVGAFMLADMLRMSNVHQVGCLVRAQSAADGMKRLRAALLKYGLWENQFAYKLLAFPGSLEDRYLGLGFPQFNELANWASVVFHLGARVNYTQPYSLHRPANTVGTINVVHFACASRVKPVHYVSSISCFGPTGFVTGATTVHEDESLLPHLKALPYDHGYAQSQWVADQLLRRLMDRGFPISIYRPGFITGHSKTGACNPDDFFSRLILACRDMGCYPNLPNQRKEFVPVDYVNSIILHIAAKPDSLGHAYHIVPPTRDASIDMNDTMKLIRDCSGSQIKGVSYQVWIERLAAAPHARLRPLQPMLAEKVQEGKTRWELYENMPLYLNSNTMQALTDFPGGLEFPVLERDLMQRYVRYLTKTST